MAVYTCASCWRGSCRRGSGLCPSLLILDIPLMWSHYTTDGSGSLIGYDAKTIRELSNSEYGLRPVL